MNIAPKSGLISRPCGNFAAALVFAGCLELVSAARAAEFRTPVIGAWHQVASNPDLGALNSPRQEPVDFGVWQAADGTWQLWSCIRYCKEPGHTRLFYRWEGAQVTDSNWKPMGIVQHGDPALGEEPGGQQAPYVFKVGDVFNMFYGDINHICRSTSSDGKTFTRVIQPDGKTGMFGKRGGDNTRDPMVLKIGDTYYCYFAVDDQHHCSVYCRTSADLKTWSEQKQVAFGGQAGTGGASAECPFVVELAPGDYYLFRTQHYEPTEQTSVYFSHDPLDFGVNHDEGHFVCRLPIAAPEIIHTGDQYYIAALNTPKLNGIRIAPLTWTEK